MEIKINDTIGKKAVLNMIASLSDEHIKANYKNSEVMLALKRVLNDISSDDNLVKETEIEFQLQEFGTMKLDEVESKIATYYRQEITSLQSISNKETNLIWVDIETTGLDINKDVILEISIVATDTDLMILDFINLAIKTKEFWLLGMGKVCTDMHTKNGLIERCRSTKDTLTSVETKCIEFLEKYSNHRTSPMCGNSVWWDRMFLVKYMPKLEYKFHYRNLDVSSIRIAADRWNGLGPMTKKKSHSAFDDTLESIDEMKYYKEHIFTRNKVVL